MNVPSRIHVVEVGPRDGFQMEQAFIPTELKIAVIDAVSRSGVRKIETTSFVSPKAVPQMADASDVMARIERAPGIAYTALIPNEKGAKRALASRVDAMRLVVCASETYNQRNVRMAVADSVAACEAIVGVAAEAEIPVEVAIGVAFGCPFEGTIPESRVLELAKTFQTMGVREIAIADTVGLANPAQVERLIAQLRASLDPNVVLSLHIHNTRGLGLANVLAGMQEGIDTFDAAIGGLGGCPVITTATGNIPTEDLVNMCEEMGIETGIDLEPIMEASRSIERFLERKLPSHVLFSRTSRQ